MQRGFITTFLGTRRASILGLLLVLGCRPGGKHHPSTMPGTDAGSIADAGIEAGAGVVNVSADAVLCADITLTIVAPRSFELGEATEISGSAWNPNGDEFTVLWSASAGRFADEKQAKTTFTCTKLGLQTLTLLVANGDLCSDAIAAAILCVAPGRDAAAGE